MQASPGCVREAPRAAASGSFRRSRFAAADAEDLAAFLTWLRRDHWTLTSLAYLREPAEKPVATARDLIAQDRSPQRVGTFLLRRDGAIIACVVVDERVEEGQRVAVFSGAETHPQYQRRGTFWRWLGIPLIRAFCHGSFDRLEAVTWALNRKGIPAYERFGFRRVPGAGMSMVNYLPTLARRPELQARLRGMDLIRDLSLEGAREMAYVWRRGDRVVRVTVKAADTGGRGVVIDSFEEEGE